MMQGLAAWAMSARWRAILVAALSAVVALVLPPVGYLGAAAVGLVTLRLGAREGFQVMVPGLAALAVLGLLGGGLALTLVAGTAALWLPVWSLSLLLRSSRSLALVLQAAAVLAAVLVFSAYLGLGEPSAWWTPRLDAMLGPVFTERGLDIGEYLPDMARWMTAALVAALVFGALVSLLLARAWQAGLYNPGGFGAEFRDLRLGRRFALMSLAVALAAQMPIVSVAQIAADLVFSLLVVYLLQGLAVAHAAVRLTQAGRGWLVGLYGMSLFAAPQMIALLGLAGWLDAWIDVRARLQGRA
jgi:hypothetical protein